MAGIELEDMAAEINPSGLRGVCGYAAIVSL